MIALSLKRLTPANIVFLFLSFAGILVFLYPFWAPSQPSDPESRTALLLFSGSIALILIALISEAQTGMNSNLIIVVGVLVSLDSILLLFVTVSSPSGVL